MVHKGCLGEKVERNLLAAILFMEVAVPWLGEEV